MLHPRLVLATLTCALACSLAAAQAPLVTHHRTNVRDWTVRVEIQLRPIRRRRAVPVVGDEFYIPRTGAIQFRDAAFAFPVLAQSAMHETYLDRLESSAQIRGKAAATGIVTESPSIPDERTVEMTLGATDIRDMIVFRVEYPMTTYETEFDEARAMRIAWPADAWPDEVLPYLAPQPFIESQDEAITKLVEEWTKGNPRKAPPCYLAKYLAGRVIEHYAPTEGDYAEQGVPLQGQTVGAENASGFIVRGAADAAERRQGSKNDLANLLVAVYRAAGIPARLVIGLDPSGTDRQTLPVTRAWAEFFLIDETTGAGEWIPVDIVNQREFSSRPPGIDRRWEFFGRNREFDTTVPIASRWEPLMRRLRAQSGPGLYGWSTDPGPQLARQTIRITAFDTPMRAGLEELEKRQERLRGNE